MSIEVIKLNPIKTIPKRAPCIPVSSKSLVIGVYIHTYKDNLNFFFWVIIYIWLSLIQYLHLKLFIAWSLPSIATTTVRCLSAISVFFLHQGFTFSLKNLNCNTRTCPNVYHLIEYTNMCQNFKQQNSSRTTLRIE